MAYKRDYGNEVAAAIRRKEENKFRDNFSSEELKQARLLRVARSIGVGLAASASFPTDSFVSLIAGMASMALGARVLDKMEGGDKARGRGGTSTGRSRHSSSGSGYEDGFKAGYADAEREAELSDSYSGNAVKMPDLAKSQGSIRGMGLSLLDNPFLIQHPTQGIIPTPGSQSGQKLYRANTKSYLGTTKGGMWGKGTNERIRI